MDTESERLDFVPEEDARHDIVSAFMNYRLVSELHEGRRVLILQPVPVSDNRWKTR